MDSLKHINTKAAISSNSNIILDLAFGMKVFSIFRQNLSYLSKDLHPGENMGMLSRIKALQNSAKLAKTMLA